MPNLFVQTVWFILKLAFLPGAWKFATFQAESACMTGLQEEILDTRSLMGFPDRYASQLRAWLGTEGVERALWDSAGQGSLCLVPWTLPHQPFPFSAFIISCNLGCDSMLSPVNGPSSSLPTKPSLGVSWGLLTLRDFKLIESK